MKRSLKIGLFLTILLLTNLGIWQAQHKSLLEVVKLFDKTYSGPIMDEIAGYTTPGFRDNKPKSVWVVETWKTLNKLKYKGVDSSISYITW